MLALKKVAETPSEVTLEATATLVSEWPMQDVDVTIALLSPEGEILGRQAWNNLTLGSWSQSYSPPRATFRVPASQWVAAFADGKAPSVRIVVELQE